MDFDCPFIDWFPSWDFTLGKTKMVLIGFSVTPTCEVRRRVGPTRRAADMRRHGGREQAASGRPTEPEVKP